MRIKNSHSSQSQFIAELSPADFPTAAALMNAGVVMELPEDYQGTSNNAYLAACFERILAEGTTSILMVDSFLLPSARTKVQGKEPTFPNILDAVFCRFQETDYYWGTAPHVSGLREAFPAVSEVSLVHATLFTMMITDSNRPVNKKSHITLRFEMSLRLMIDLPEFPAPQEFATFLSLVGTMNRLTQSEDAVDYIKVWELAKKNPEFSVRILEEKIKATYRDKDQFIDALLSLDSLGSLQEMPNDILDQLFPAEKPPKNWRYNGH